MWIIEHRNLFFTISGALVAGSLAAVMFLGVTLGIDFTGGSLLEVRYEEVRPEQERVELRLEQLGIGGFSLRATDDMGYLLRSKELSESERADVMDALSLSGAAEAEMVRLNTVGPTIGQELRSKALVAIVTVILMIVVFVAFAFRNRTEAPDEERRPGSPPPEPVHYMGVSSWTYGWIAIVALLHDILIPVGVFSILGYFFGAEIDVLFVMALLAILGYSINDTIVVFDRVRENLRNNYERDKSEDFAETVGRSLRATIARSINTSLTTLFVLVALVMLGGDSTRYFGITLIAGVLAGTYSSIALASPLLVAAERARKAKKQA